MHEVERSELDAVDTALAGGVVAAEYEELAELALTLRSLRARPNAAFAAALDERAAQGFRRPAPRPALLRRLTPAAAGIALAGIAAAVVAVSVSPGPGHSTAAKSAAGRLNAGRAESGASAAEKATSKSVPAVAAQSFTTGEEVPPARQIEHGSTLDVGVAPDALKNAAHRVFGIAAAYGGYVTQSNVSSGAVGQSYASFQLRVPSAGLSGAIAALSQLGRVRSETDTTNDVTGEHESLTRSLGDLRAERASLLRQIAAAGEAAALAELRARLHAVEGRIASVEAALHALQQRVQLSPLALSLTAETAAAGSGSGSSLTPGSALGVAGRILTAGLAVLVIALAAAVPLALVVAAGGATLTRSRKHARERALDAA